MADENNRFTFKTGVQGIEVGRKPKMRPRGPIEFRCMLCMQWGHSTGEHIDAKGLDPSPLRPDKS